MKRILFSLLALCLLIPLPGRNTQAQDPALPISGQLAAVLEDGNLWVLIGDTGERIQITTDAGEARRYLSPRWSPDGQRLAYCQQETVGGPGALYVTRAGEWLPILLAQDVFCREWPEGSFDWSPQGESILFAHFDASDPEPGGLWAVDFNTGGISQVVAPPGRNPLRRPHFSPDGEWVRLYEVLYLEGLGVLRTWNRASGNLYNWLETGADLFPGYASWSPDGSQVVFDEVTYLGFPGAGLYVAGPDGSGVRRIYSAPYESAIRPMWSPRGDWIAFQLSTPGVNASQGVRLLIVSPDASAQREIHTGDASLTPLGWSPDGSTLLFAQQESGLIGLYGYTPDDEQVFWITAITSWDVDWSQEDLILDLAKDLEPRAVPGFPYGEQSLLYLAPDYQLVLENLGSGASVELTEPMSVAGFWVSPSRQRMLTSNRLIALDFSENGDMLIRQVGLPSPAAGWAARWSVDEGRVAYQDRQGDAWIVSVDGVALQVPEAGSLPEWSADGRWISYCTRQNVLTIIGPDVPRKTVAEDTYCQARWSPGDNLLAYTLRGDDEPDSNQVVVYNPQEDSEMVIEGGGRFEGWSPDGRLLALRRPADTANAYVIYAADPVEGRLRAIGRFDHNGPYNQEWLDVDGGYQYGPFRVPADLSGVNRIVDEVYAAAPGGTLLAGIGAGDIVTLACSGDQQAPWTTLFAVDQTGMPDELAPGVQAILSPDGAWAALYAYDRGVAQARLVRCDGEVIADLPAESQASLAAFAPDGSQFVQSMPPGNAQSGVLLYELSTLTSGAAITPTRTITTAGGAPAFWLSLIQPAEAALPRLSGTVRDPDGRPVAGATLYLDGQAAAVSTADGSYLIPDVAPGRHTLRVEAGTWDFSQDSQAVNVPPDMRGVDFEASRAKALPQITQAPEPQEPEDQEAPPVEAASGPTWMETLNAWLVAFGLAEAWPVILAGFIGLAGAGLGAWIVRRRRKASGEAVDEDQPEIAAQPEEIEEEDELAEPVEESETEPEMPPTVAPFETVSEEDGEPEAELAPAQPLAESKAAVLYPSDEQIEAWLKSGIQATKRGAYEHAWVTLRKLVMERPDNPSAWLWMGWTAARRGDRRTARRCLEKARTLGHPRAEEALAWLDKNTR